MSVSPWLECKPHEDFSVRFTALSLMLRKAPTTWQVLGVYCMPESTSSSRHGGGTVLEQEELVLGVGQTWLSGDPGSAPSSCETPGKLCSCLEL